MRPASDPEGPSDTSIWRHQYLYRLGWESLGAILDRLRAEVVSSYEPTAIVAISRGGLVPGTYFSNRLSVPTFMALGISRNTGDGQWTTKVQPRLDWSSAPLTTLAAERVLLVDDVVGEGATLQTACNALTASDVAAIRTLAIVRMKIAGYPTDYCGLQLDDWVVFPWEAPPEVGVPIRDV